MSISSRIIEMEEHIRNAYDKIEDLGIDTTNINKNINNISSILETVWNEQPKVLGQGTHIVLKNVRKGKMNIELNGRTEQAQYSGKNKANTGEYTTIPSSQRYINVPTEIEAGSYILSLESWNSDGEETYSALEVRDDDGALFYGEIGSNKLSLSFTISENATYVRIYSQRSYNTSVNVTTTISKLMVREASITDDSYEPYCGGIESPNSIFPQIIHNTKGNIVNKISNKNLAWNGWAQDYVERVSNSTYSSLVSYENKRCLKYLCSSGYNEYNSKYLFKTKWKENTQYTFQFDILKEDTTASIFSIVYTDGTQTILPNLSDINKWESVELTSSPNKTILYATPYYTSGLAYIDLDTFMVEEGTTATNYVAHAEQNYPFTFAEGQRGMQGTTLQDNGIHQKRVHVILDGTENWQVYLNKEHCFKLPINFTSASGLCSHYQNIGSTYFDLKDGIYLTYTNTVIISDLRFSSVEEFKIGLSQQYNNGTPVEIEYVIRNDEEIIPYNETQQAQYDAIKKATSYDDITIISSESDDLGFNINAVGLEKSVNQVLGGEY